MRHISGVVTAGQLLELIIDRPRLTRGQLLEITGISRTTLLSRIESLFNLDMLVEEASGGTGRPGRPAGRLRVKDVERTVMVADLGVDQAQLAVTDGTGQMLRTSTLDHDVTRGPEPVMEEVLDRLQQMLADSGRSEESLCGVGLAVPGPVSAETRRVIGSLWLDSWNDHDLQAHVWRRWDIPLLVDNDANVMALGEAQLSQTASGTSVLVKMGSGIGAGVVIDGAVHRGSRHLEGELGHARLPWSGPGQDGQPVILADVASGLALAAQLRTAGRDVTTARQVAGLVRGGDDEATQLLQEAGRATGRVVGMSMPLLDFDRLVVGGDLADTGEVLLTAVREGVSQVLHPMLLDGLEVVHSQQNGEAAMLGALRMVHTAVFSADAVDAAVDR